MLALANIAKKNPGCAVTRAGGNVVFGLDRTNAQYTFEYNGPQ